MSILIHIPLFVQNKHVSYFVVNTETSFICKNSTKTTPNFFISQHLLRIQMKECNFARNAAILQSALYLVPTKCGYVVMPTNNPSHLTGTSQQQGVFHLCKKLLDLFNANLIGSRSFIKSSICKYGHC